MERIEVLAMIHDELARQLDKLWQQVQNIRETARGLPIKNDD